MLSRGHTDESVAFRCGYFTSTCFQNLQSPRQLVDQLEVVPEIFHSSQKIFLHVIMLFLYLFGFENIILPKKISENVGRVQPIF
jgi:hypothetical protein